MGVVYLIRHGQASFGAEDYDALSETGVRQAQVLGAALHARLPRVEAAVCGSMQRHRQTAEACLASMGLAHAPREDAGWNEYDHDDVLWVHAPHFRDRERMAAHLSSAVDPRRAFQDVFGQAVVRWASGAHDAEYRESWPAFLARVGGALGRLVAGVGKGQTALVFTSGGVISAVCRGLLRMSDADALRLHWTLANAAVTKLLTSERGITLSTLNEHGYLEAAGAGLVTYR